MFFCKNCGSILNNNKENCAVCNVSSEAEEIIAQDFSQYEDAAYSDDYEAMYRLAICYLEGIGTQKDVYSAFYWMEKAASNNISPAVYRLGKMYLDGIGVAPDLGMAQKWMNKFESENATNVSVEKTSPEDFSDWFGAGGAEPCAVEVVSGNEDIVGDAGDEENGEIPGNSCENESDEYEQLLETADDLLSKGIESEDSGLMKQAAECYMKAAEQGYADGYINIAWMYLSGWHYERSHEMALYYQDKAKNCKDFSDYENKWMATYLNIYLEPGCVSADDAFEILDELMESDMIYAAKSYLDAIDTLFASDSVDDIADDIYMSLRERRLECAKIVADDIIQYGEEDDSLEYIVMYLECLSDLFDESHINTIIKLEESILRCIEYEDYAESVLVFADTLYENSSNRRCASLAFSIYSESAQNGNTYAKYKTGYCYDLGIGTSEDHTEANYWYELASDEGHEAACFNLALNLEEGVGCELNVERAMSLYRKACDLGYTNAYFNLGVCYEADEDYVSAAKMYKKAIENENTDDEIKTKAKTRYSEATSHLSFTQKMFL